MRATLAVMIRRMGWGHGRRRRTIRVAATKVVIGVAGSSTVRVSLAIVTAVGAMGSAVALCRSTMLMATMVVVSARACEGCAGGRFAGLAFAQCGRGARPDR